MKRAHHYFVRQPLELWSFKLWPLFIVFLWISILATGGVLGYEGWFFYSTTIAALVGSSMHFVWPYDDRVRYIALSTNLVAMAGRSVDYILDGYGWRIALAGAAIWLTLAAAKMAVFFLSAALVEMHVARVQNGGA